MQQAVKPAPAELVIDNRTCSEEEEKLPRRREYAVQAVTSIALVRNRSEQNNMTATASLLKLKV